MKSENPSGSNGNVDLVSVSRAFKLTLGFMFVALALAIAIPNYIRAHMTRSLHPCIDVNLWAIADAKERWGNENNKGGKSVPTQNDLLPYLQGGKWPVCFTGGKYEIGPLDSHPWCSLSNEHPWSPVRYNINHEPPFTEKLPLNLSAGE